MNRGVKRLADWSNAGGLKVIGMDEIALRKGLRDFVVIVTLRGADEDIASPLIGPSLRGSSTVN